MISANEAAKLVLISTVNVEKYISLIEPEIIKIANDGKRIYACYVDGLWTSVNNYDAISAKFSYIQQSVATKLREYGYIVNLSRDGDEYVPRGLDDGDGPIHVNVCLIIKW